MNPNDYKNISPERLDYILEGIKFKTQPMVHQKCALVFISAIRDPRVTWWFDVGTGKTLTALYANQIWGYDRLLITCPNSVVESWEDQINEHTDETCCLLRGTLEERRELLRSNPSKIFIVNYEGLQVLFGDRYKVGKHTKWKINPQLIKEANIDALVFDECQRLQSPDSHVTKIAQQLSYYTDKIINMTATAFSTGVDDLHSQYLVLDGGKTLGTSRKRFLKDHFKQDFWKHWHIREGETEKIIDRIAPVTLHFDVGECFDLPEKVYQTRYLTMTDEQHNLIEDLIVGTPITYESETLECVEPMVVGNKLSQIAGGLLKFHDKTMRLTKQPKLDELDSILQEIPGKTIIFHGYVEEGRMIEDRLEAAGIGYVSMRSEIRDKTCWRKFRDDPNIRVLVAHPASGGVGLNLQCSACIIFYSNSCAGASIRTQAEGRIWRLGQKNRCLIIDLVVRGSLDERRLQTVQDRAEIVAEIKDYISNW